MGGGGRRISGEAVPAEYAAEKKQRQHESTQYIRLNQQGDLPEKFTLEFDAVLSHVGMSIHPGGTLPTDKLMFTNFRLAEGGKNIRSALDTDGKIITHGILFDTGKDVIKPESLPTLKSIFAILNDDPGLNFSIEGHTDNQGNKAINQPLSEKRASAVSAWLADKGIAAERLKIKGLGDTMPIDSNATPEGRANNRRVEFVKF
ncbi:MAG: OmpA family protein [Syntrophales bacterium]